MRSQLLRMLKHRIGFCQVSAGSTVPSSWARIPATQVMLNLIPTSFELTSSLLALVPDTLKRHMADVRYGRRVAPAHSLLLNIERCLSLLYYLAVRAGLHHSLCLNPEGGSRVELCTLQWLTA